MTLCDTFYLYSTLCQAKIYFFLLNAVCCETWQEKITTCRNGILLINVDLDQNPEKMKKLTDKNIFFDEEILFYKVAHE